MPAKRYLPTRNQPVAILFAAVVGILIATLAPTALAHEGRAVGDYNLVVGFLQEPAYEGQLNAVSLVVTKPTNESTDHHQDTETEAHHHAEHADDNHHAMTNAQAVDVMVHGAIFTSPQIGNKEKFEFEISDELSGIEIPYHVHPGDQEGVIVVSTKTADHGHDQSIKIMDDHVVPDRLGVMVGDTVVWENLEAHSAVVMSGTLSPVITDMTAQIGNDASNDASDNQTVSPRDRVSDLAPNLQVEISHLPTAVSRVLALTELIDDPGHYVAEFIPTAPGDYRVRFFGSIEGNPVDETFDSGPDTFDTVIASDAIQFPVVLESNREIQNATRGTFDAVQNLEADLHANSSNASTGMIIGSIGIVFGAIAAGISLFAFTIARRRN